MSRFIVGSTVALVLGLAFLVWSNAVTAARVGTATVDHSAYCQVACCQAEFGCAVACEGQACRGGGTEGCACCVDGCTCCAGECICDTDQCSCCAEPFAGPKDCGTEGACSTGKCCTMTTR